MNCLRLIAATVFVALFTGCAAQPRGGLQAAGEPGMLLVSAGRFIMGNDKGELNERPSHKVEIGSFAMDRTEVSAREFAEFLNAAGSSGDLYFTADEHATVMAAPADGRAATARYSARPGLERFPANNVSWEGANAYCRWRGKRLPTEAEWEKAARGTDKRRFPWGRRDPGEELARFEQIWQEKQFDVFVPVDALPEGASPYGLLNMAGNVLEWVNDWYRQNLCDFCNPEAEGNLDLIRQLTGRPPEAPAVGPTAASGGAARERSSRRVRQVPLRVDPGGPTTGSFRVLRGGSWQDRQEQDLATTRRYWLDPAQRFPHTGFRCSKDSPRTP